MGDSLSHLSLLLEFKQKGSTDCSWSLDNSKYNTVDGCSKYNTVDGCSKYNTVDGCSKYNTVDDCSKYNTVDGCSKYSKTCNRERTQRSTKSFDWLCIIGLTTPCTMQLCL